MSQKSAAMTSFVRRGSSMDGPAAAADAEHERELKAERLRTTRNLRVFLAGHVVLGLSTMGVSVYTLTFDDVLMQYMRTFFGILEEGYAALWNIFVLIPMFAGLGAIALAAVALKSSSERGLHLREQATKNIFRASLIVLTLLFIGQIVFGAGYLFVLSALKTTIESQALDSASTGVASFEADMSTLQLAAFNLCCEEQGWSVQGVVPACDASGNAPATCGLPPSSSPFSDVLCTCYPSANRYTEYSNALRDTGLNGDLCRIMSDAVVQVSAGARIPGTDLPLSSVVPASEARIVGVNTPPEYGCGFGGYARAFQWMQFEYLSQNSQYIPVAMIIISVMELLLIVAIRCRQFNGDEQRFFDDMMDDIETVRMAHPDEKLGGAAFAKELGLHDKGARRRSKAMAPVRPAERPAAKQAQVEEAEEQGDDEEEQVEAKVETKKPKDAGMITPLTPMPDAGRPLPRISLFTMPAESQAESQAAAAGGGDDNEDDDEEEAAELERDPSVAF